jgi:hypothetical protein
MDDIVINGGHRRRRLVVFIGPPKTASTSLEEFLSRYADDDNKTYASSFANWTYPRILGHPNGLKELRFGPQENPATFAKIEQQIRRVVRHHPEKSIILGTEYLTAIVDVQNHLLNYLVNWTTPIISSNTTTTTTTTTTSYSMPSLTPEIVVLYRSPRISHFLSIWKQATQIAGKPYYGYSFQDWMCSPNKETRAFVQAKLVRHGNPLDFIHKLSVQKHLPTYLIDMGGLQNNSNAAEDLDLDLDLDICHVFACDVLKVPCNSQSRILGLENVVIRKNSRKGNPNLTEPQLEALEHVFSLRDCNYFRQLQNHSLVTILHRHKLWDRDCPEMDPMYRTNVSTMMDRMQQILQCPGVVEVVVTPSSSLLAKKSTTANNPVMDDKQENSSHYIPESRREGSQLTVVGNVIPSFGWLADFQLLGVVFLLVIFNLGYCSHWRRRNRLDVSQEVKGR